MEINAPDNLFFALHYLSIAFLLAASLLKLKTSLSADNNFVIYQLSAVSLTAVPTGARQGTARGITEHLSHWVLISLWILSATANWQGRAGTNNCKLQSFVLRYILQRKEETTSSPKHTTPRTASLGGMSSSSAKLWEHPGLCPSPRLPWIGQESFKKCFSKFYHSLFEENETPISSKHDRPLTNQPDFQSSWSWCSQREGGWKGMLWNKELIGTPNEGCMDLMW